MNAPYSVVIHQDCNTREVIFNISQDQMKVRKYIWEKDTGNLVILTLFDYSGKQFFFVCKEVLHQNN